MGIFTKPSKLPEWASDDSIVDTTSGQNNVVEPDSGRKAEGWKFNEKPPRQYFNWLHNLYYEWLKAFDDNFNQSCQTTDDVIFNSVETDSIADNGGALSVIGTAAGINISSSTGDIDLTSAAKIILNASTILDMNGDDLDVDLTNALSLIATVDSEIKTLNGNLDLTAAGSGKKLRLQPNLGGDWEASGVDGVINPGVSLSIKFPGEADLDHYNEDTGSLTIENVSSGPTSIGFRYKIVNQKYVVLSWEQASGFQLSAAGITLSSLPADIRPNTNMVLYGMSVQNATDTTEHNGIIRLTSGGDMTIYEDNYGDTFPTSKSLQIRPGSISYNVEI